MISYVDSGNEYLKQWLIYINRDCGHIEALLLGTFSLWGDFRVENISIMYVTVIKYLLNEET